MLDGDTPFALAVVGSAGSGKSTIARVVARRARAAYIDKDSVAGPLVDAAMQAQGQPLEVRESNDFYRANLMPAEYEAVFAVACDNLQLGRPVVIDAPFAAYLSEPEFFENAARNWPKVERFVLHVVASEETTRARLHERGLPRDRAKLNNWNEFWSRWGQPSIAWSGVHLMRLDNDESPDIEGVLAQLCGEHARRDS
ncbi:MAG: AAA family ATPase [Mycetocola sp.]